MTDFYDVCETALVELLRSSLPERFEHPENQVTKSDDTVLMHGYDYFAITYPGAFPTEFAGVQQIQTEWEIVIDILVRLSTEPEAWINFKGFRSDIFNLINRSEKGRTLNRTAFVRRTLLSANERPRYVPMTGGSPDGQVAFVAQALSLTVTQHLNKE